MAGATPPSDLLFSIEKQINSPSGQLRADAKDLIGQVSSHAIRDVTNQILGKVPSLLMGIIGGMVRQESVGDAMRRGAQEAVQNADRKSVIRDMEALKLSRPTVGLTNQERTLIKCMAGLRSAHHLNESDWKAFVASMVWHDGQCQVTDSGGKSRNPRAVNLLVAIVTQNLQKHAAFLERATATVARHKAAAPDAGKLVDALLTPGARWATDTELTAGDTFGPRARQSLNLGWLGSAKSHVFYNNDESLISIGGPGTGKTQAQVIPNLILYPGSMFVLDLKGELYDQTAAHRQKQFGPVYRFSPAEPSGRTHAYNPFDAISADPQQASSDCSVLATQLMPANPSARDPYWEGRARDMLWAFSLVIALEASPERRNLTSVLQLLSMPTSFEDLSSSHYRQSVTAAVMAKLHRLSTDHDLPGLKEIAVAIESTLTTESTRLETVLDVARRSLSIFGRSRLLRNAMQRSDWNPLQLREQPGTTVYLTLSGDDIDTYMPLVRVIFRQHADALLRHFGHAQDQLPVTFMLDEMPQLGHLDSITRLIDVGRGAKLRLWLFAQNIGQLRSIYDKRADGLINSCRVRCFFQPDNEAVELLTPQLGTTQHVFTGEKKPLAEPYELMGPAFSKHMIITARGEHPAKIAPQYAYKVYGRYTSLAPPEVPVCSAFATAERAAG